MHANPAAGRIGVGFLGAGPVTQAIHLPTLARLSDTFRVARIMDVDPCIAEAVAARVGAAWSTSQQELFDDPDVDVVAICSPHPYHADQVVAACRAGVRAVLCEKPFAVSGEQAATIARVSAETGVPIVVGAMHAYDPGWSAAIAQAADLVPHTIRSSISLPPNARFEDFATEVVSRPAPQHLDRSDPEAVARALEGGILGLAIHDLPLIRQLLRRVSPEAWQRVRLLSAEPVHPGGYLVVLRADEVLIELHAVMSQNWEPSWHLTATDDRTLLDMEFTPSYVQAGSATATVTGPGGSVTVAARDANGYEGEWLHLAALVGGVEPLVPARELIHDLEFAIRIAEDAARAVRAGTGVAA